LNREKELRDPEEKGQGQADRQEGVSWKKGMSTKGSDLEKNSAKGNGYGSP